MSYGIGLSYLADLDSGEELYNERADRAKNGKDLLSDLKRLAHSVVRNPMGLIAPSEDGSTLGQKAEQFFAGVKDLYKKGQIADGAYEKIRSFYYNAFKPFVGYMREYISKYVLPEQVQQIQALGQKKEEASAALAQYSKNTQGLASLLSLSL